MSSGTRAFFVTGLVALAAAATLHFMVLWGLATVWYPAIHLTIFGWITAMIVGVNYHTLPVFGARDFPHPRLINAHWAAFSTGIVLSTTALLSGSSAGTMAGLMLELLAAAIFVANTVLLFTRGPKRAQGPPAPPLPGQAVVDRMGTAATMGAGVALPVALLLLFGVNEGRLGAAWVLAAEHLAVLGWVMLMIVGVAYHVLPRFSGHSVRGVGWVRAQLTCHYAALVLMVPALGFGWTSVFAVGGVLMTTAFGLFAWTVWPTLIAVQASARPIQISLEEVRR